MSPLDLHVLGTPPAFVLSQDQTLVFNPSHRASLRFRSLPGAPASAPRAAKLFGIFAVSLTAGPRSVFRPPRNPTLRSFLLARFSFSVSFSRFGPLCLPSRPFPSVPRASLYRLSKTSDPVKHFFEEIRKKFLEIFYRLLPAALFSSVSRSPSRILRAATTRRSAS